jgi:hypothetical protein
MRFRGTEKVVAEMKRGAHLILRRDPNNRHDPNAVEVWYGLQHVAFIKATEAVGLAKAMDNAGFREFAGSFTVTADRWPQVEVDSR